MDQAICATAEFRRMHEWKCAIYRGVKNWEGGGERHDEAKYTPGMAQRSVVVSMKWCCWWDESGKRTGYLNT